jgi:hypothetical protein
MFAFVSPLCSAWGFLGQTQPCPAAQEGGDGGFYNQVKTIKHGDVMGLTQLIFNGFIWVESINMNVREYRRYS